MKFSIKDFFSKCDQIRSFLRISPHLLKKCLIENFIFLCSGGELDGMGDMDEEWGLWVAEAVVKDHGFGGFGYV